MLVLDEHILRNPYNIMLESPFTGAHTAKEIGRPTTAQRKGLETDEH